MTDMGNPIPTRRLDQATLYLGHTSMPTRHAAFEVHFFQDLAHDRAAMAIVHGDLQSGAPLLARVHSSCLTSECLSGRDCDCAEQLDGALAMIAAEGDGVVFYLMQEGRGAGLTAKARDRMIVQASENQKTTFDAYAEMGLPRDLRRYDVLAPMSRILGLASPLRLLTNNPEKVSAVAKVFAEEAIELCRMETIHGPTSPFNRDYLAAKHDSGHAFDRPARSVGGRPPVDVRMVEPFVLGGENRRVLTASYFLPIALPVHAIGGFMPGSPRNSPNHARRGVDEEATPPDRDEPRLRKTGIDWFRLSVIFDGERSEESIVLTHRDSKISDLARMLRDMPDSRPPNGEADAREDGVLRRGGYAISMSLLDRLPTSDSSQRFALTEALLAIQNAGSGSVSVRFDDRHRALPESVDASDRTATPAPFASTGVPSARGLSDAVERTEQTGLARRVGR